MSRGARVPPRAEVGRVPVRVPVCIPVRRARVIAGVRAGGHARGRSTAGLQTPHDAGAWRRGLSGSHSGGGQHACMVAVLRRGGGTAALAAVHWHVDWQESRHAMHTRGGSRLQATSSVRDGRQARREEDDNSHVPRVSGPRILPMRGAQPPLNCAYTHRGRRHTAQ